MLTHRQVDQTLDYFGTLKSQHHEVAAKTRQLHDNCQQLVRPYVAAASVCHKHATMYTGNNLHRALLRVGSAPQSDVIAATLRHPLLQVSEKDQLADFAQALRTKLAFFDELEAVGGRFHGSSAPSVDSDSFLPLLARLDDSLAFVAAHPQCATAGCV